MPPKLYDVQTQNRRHHLFRNGNAVKGGMLEVGASERIIAAMNSCWGAEYPEETRYLNRHLDSYISGQENLEPQIDAWLKANPH